jgi:hypothetical protein
MEVWVLFVCLFFAYLKCWGQIHDIVHTSQMFYHCANHPPSPVFPWKHTEDEVNLEELPN